MLFNKSFLINRYIVLISIILYYSTEPLATVYRLNNKSLENPFGFIKLFTLSYFFVIFIFYTKGEAVIQKYKILILICSLFILVNIVSGLDGVLKFDMFVFNFKVFIKLIFPFVVLDVFIYIKEDKVNLYKKVGCLFQIILLINFGLQIVGLVFDIDSLRSYTPFRFGYSGSFYARNEATGFYILMMLLSLVNRRKMTPFDYLVFFSSVVGGLLLGTKGFLLFFGCFLLLQFFFIKSKKIKIIVGLSFLFIIIISVVSIIKIAAIFPDENLYFVISSKRNELLMQFFSKIKSYNLISAFHLFFGGLPFKPLETQIEIVDIFLLLGIAMGMLYFFVFYSNFIKVIKDDMIKYSMLFLYFLIGGLAGHIFISALNILLLGYVVSVYHINEI